MRKMVQYNLLKNSISAYYAAIELHNKPNISYRYETVTLLMINAWELMLKAFIRKFFKDKSIFKDNNYTISFDTSLAYTEEYISANFQKGAFKAIKENLLLLEEYRDKIVHFYNEAIEPIIFTLLAKGALNYVEFIKKYFRKDILAKEGLFIMPLGFKLPFKPEDYLSNKSSSYNYSQEVKDFINNIVKVVEDLRSGGIEDSVVLGFNLYLDSVKKISNSDLLVAITNKDEAEIRLMQTKKISITNDPNATRYYISEEEIFNNYPLTHREVQHECKRRYIDCLINSDFYRIMGEIEKNPNLAYGRKLDAKQIKPVKHLYSPNVFDILDKHYIKKENTCSIFTEEN